MAEIKVKCRGCGKCPDALKECVNGSRIEEVTPEEYVKQNDGTYNPATGLFYCDMCYVKSGCPLGTA